MQVVEVDMDEIQGDNRQMPLNQEQVRTLADLMLYCIFLCFIFSVVFLNPAEDRASKIIQGMLQTLDNGGVMFQPLPIVVLR
jgi:hypothetical protein